MLLLSGRMKQKMNEHLSDVSLSCTITAPSLYQVELVPGGASQEVTDENKAEYIELYEEINRHHHRWAIAAPSLHHHCTIAAR